jgi:hypothetical protein
VGSSAEEYAMLKSYWATNAADNKDRDSDAARFGRSVSTGSLPNANANANVAHNDRVIDGALSQSLSLLGGLRRIQSTGMARDHSGYAQSPSAATICQLDRNASSDSGSPRRPAAQEAARSESQPATSSGHDVAETIPSSTNSSTPYQSSAATLMTSLGLRRTAAGMKDKGKDSEAQAVKNDSKTAAQAAKPANSVRAARRLEGPVPLCFVVSGGEPRGRVSWMINVLPHSPQRLRYHQVGSSGELTPISVHTPEPEAAGTSGSSQDWRAIFK